MKRPTVIETLAFLGLALTGIRTDQSGSASLAETGTPAFRTTFGQTAGSPEHQEYLNTRGRPEPPSNVESVDTLLASRNSGCETQPPPHQ